LNETVFEKELAGLVQQGLRDAMGDDAKMTTMVVSQSEVLAMTLLVAAGGNVDRLGILIAEVNALLIDKAARMQAHANRKGTFDGNAAA
jgi:hypothetical protein